MIHNTLKRIQINNKQCMNSIVSPFRVYYSLDVTLLTIEADDGYMTRHKHIYRYNYIASMCN